MDRPARAKRSLGQNFLVDRGAVRRIAERVAAEPGEPLLEIGPGRGALTEALLEAAERVVVVELDSDLASRLSERFDPSRIRIVTDDILRVDLEALSGSSGLPAEARWVVAGNLPYNISKPVARWIVTQRRRVERAVLMFQREVAERLTAQPGSADYGPLSVLVGETFQVGRAFDLPPAAFRPRPKVVSTVTCWTPHVPERLDRETETDLVACLSACFGQRRKTLRNNLRAHLANGDTADRLLGAAGLDGRARPQDVDPVGYRRLASVWSAIGDGRL